MKIRFAGGAQTVTGSQHLLTINGKKLLLECGLYQGRRKDTYKINQNFLYHPEEIDAVVLSHAHIDHSGNIPNLVKNGFNGPIYATAATVDLCQIMLRDSAYIHEMDAKWLNKRRIRKGIEPVDPLYTMDDAERACEDFVGMQYDHAGEIAPGVFVTFRDAGHILGSAAILLEINENGKKMRVGFSGDIGRQDMPIIRNPNQLRDLDVLIMESTYGDRVHDHAEDVAGELAQSVRMVADRGGKIIIPAFAVGRTQLLVYMLHKLFDQNRIPSMPIFVDSPLAVRATEVFRVHPECYDREMQRVFLQNHVDPFGFGRLTYTHSVEESKSLNNLKIPHIIISASGMAEAGRILHHLRNNIGDEKNLVLFVGYAAKHTLARKLMEGEKTVRIFGETHEVKSEIKSMNYFSAHADRNEMLDYLSLVKPDRLQHLFLVHGEEKQALPFKQTLESAGYRSVHYPVRGETIEL